MHCCPYQQISIGVSSRYFYAFSVELVLLHFLDQSIKYLIILFIVSFNIIYSLNHLFNNFSKWFFHLLLLSSFLIIWSYHLHFNLSNMIRCFHIFSLSIGILSELLCFLLPQSKVVTFALLTMFFVKHCSFSIIIISFSSIYLLSLLKAYFFSLMALCNSLLHHDSIMYSC